MTTIIAVDFGKGKLTAMQEAMLAAMAAQQGAAGK